MLGKMVLRGKKEKKPLRSRLEAAVGVGVGADEATVLAALNSSDGGNTSASSNDFLV